MRALVRRLPRPLYLHARAAYFRWRGTASQFGQDDWVIGELFNGHRGGYFVDIGAADGLTLSNTFILEQHYGWRGLCIEADTIAFKDLAAIRQADCVNICLDAAEGTVDFTPRSLFGGIVGTGTDNPSVTGTVLRLATRSLRSVLIEHGAPTTIDYLSIDVEGAEDRILTGFAFDQYVFRCITIERPKPELRDILRRQGYVLIKEIPGYDVFYVHESFVPTYRANVLKFWEGRRGVREPIQSP